MFAVDVFPDYILDSLPISVISIECRMDTATPEVLPMCKESDRLLVKWEHYG